MIKFLNACVSQLDAQYFVGTVATIDYTIPASDIVMFQILMIFQLLLTIVDTFMTLQSLHDIKVP